MLILALSSLLILSSCGENNATTSASPAPTSTATTGLPDSSVLQEFTGLAFVDQSVVYDGAKHSLVVQNLPEGAMVVYSGQDYVNVGSYPVDATVTKTGFTPKNLHATLTISEADLTAEKVASLGLSFKDASYPYDAESHTLQLTGDVPTGTNVSYTIDGQNGNSATEVGEHVVVATLKIPNYHPYQLTAKLTIVAVEKELFSTHIGSTILFQNDLDSDVLYSYEDGLKRVSRDVVGGFSGMGSFSFGIVKTLWGKAVVRYAKDGEGNLTKTKVLAGVPVETIAAVDATHFYYSIKNLLVNKADNGLYYYDTDKVDDDYRGEKVAADIAPSTMVYADKVLYFIGEDKTLCSYNPSAKSKTVYNLEGKIYDLIVKDGFIYYNKGNLAAKGLFRMEIASQKESQLTIDNGRDLTIIGTSLYYINKDLLTSTLFGKGIYKVPLDGTSLNASGSLVVSGENDKIGSLICDGTSLYYYRFNTDHFFKNTAAGNAEVDLMADFVKPEDTTLVGGAANAYANGQVYFANLKDDGCLYKYDLTSKQAFKVLPYSVNNVFVNGNYLYFGSYLLSNYAEWRMDLTSKVISKISKDRCESLRFVGDVIYYLNVGATKATLHQMNADGTNDRELVSDGMDPFSLEVMGGKAYTVRDPLIGNKSLAVIDLASGDLNKTDKKCLSFVKGADNELFLYNGADKTLVDYKVDTAVATTLVSGIAALSDLAYVNGHLYAQDVNAKKLIEYSASKLTSIAEVAPSGIVGDGTSLYFVAAKTVFANNYPATAYDKATSNGALYAYGSDLTCLASF